MSDFDKEAERERLREKYEDDRRKRQSTQRMSELLLQGATMTDRHCEECGNPIFRYDGQEFCPTCRGEGAADAPEATDADEGTGTAEGEASEAAVEVGTPAERPEATPAASPDADTDRQSPESTPPATTDATPRDAGEGAGDRTTARASLERTLVRFAREAEATDDPRRARDLLAAAREAAETLAALDRR